jgi:hypothetical protein
LFGYALQFGMGLNPFQLVRLTPILSIHFWIGVTEQTLKEDKYLHNDYYKVVVKVFGKSHMRHIFVNMDNIE